MIYTAEEEALFKKSGEECECMSILHNLSHLYYSKLSVWTNVPVIILSSCIGFLSTVDLFKNQNLMLGVLSISVSIIKSLDSFFDYTRRCEAHRITGLSYMKIAKLIEIQLTLRREDRLNAEDLLGVINNDVATLRESEPAINQNIIKLFNQKYSKEITHKPNLVNGLTNIQIFKSSQNDQSTQIDILENIESPVSPVTQKREWKR